MTRYTASPWAQASAAQLGPSSLNVEPILPRFGETFDMARDGKRLTLQAHRVLAVFGDGGWHTLSELAKRTGDPEASISARIRELRTARFGSHTIQREYVRRGLFRYRLVIQSELAL